MLTHEEDSPAKKCWSILFILFLHQHSLLLLMRIDSKSTRDDSNEFQNIYYGG